MVGQGDDTLAQCGYINKSGELVIALAFHGAQNFRNGIAAVFINEPALTKQKADEQRKKNILKPAKS